MSTLRRSLVLLALTVLAALAAGLAVLDPFHLRHAAWFVAGTVLATVVLATLALAVAVKLYLVRVLVLVLGGILAVAWAAVSWLAMGLTDDARPVSEVASGAQRLVVLEGAPFAIDPVYRVVLRAGDGPFEQQSDVWIGYADGPVPDAVAFRGTDEVEIAVGTCLLVSRVEPVTLAVDPVHRAAPGC
ncbi:MAG: hypothetical protein NTW05_10635 [Pseudonocardiales bacterium]|nr:hypothetical protein [Pseudonocardiales bacterium]